MKDLERLVQILHEQIKERSSQHAVIQLTISELPISVVNTTFPDVVSRISGLASFGDYISKEITTDNGITIRLESVYF